MTVCRRFGWTFATLALDCSQLTFRASSRAEANATLSSRLCTLSLGIRIGLGASVGAIGNLRDSFSTLASGTINTVSGNATPTTGVKAPDLHVLERLHQKFTTNLASVAATPPPGLESVEIKIRALAEAGQLLRRRSDLSPSQILLTLAADEIFADVTCAGYLAAISLTCPAQLVLRRALELGLALVYLWDLPHLFWGWKECDHDLSFKDMLSHIESPAFATLLRNIGIGLTTEIIDGKSARDLYRKLSNTVHGKFDTMATLSPDHYEPDPLGWAKHIQFTDQALDLILQLWLNRFPQIKNELDSAFPQILRVRTSPKDGHGNH